MLCAGAQAHSPYLKPNTFSAAEQRKHVTVEASFAESDLRPDVAMTSEAFRLIGPDGKKLPVAPAAVLKDASYLEVPLGAGSGTFLISSGVRKGRLAKGVLRQGKVHFTEYKDDSKVGSVDYDTEGVEIYPVTKPHDLYAGEPITVHLPENRKPLAGEADVKIAEEKRKAGKTSFVSP